MKKLDRTERVLSALESALTSDLETLSGTYGARTEESLEPFPVHLQDPFAVIERGQALLRSGIPHRAVRIETAFDNELRMAARNGKPIPEEVRTVMSEDRDLIEPVRRLQPVPSILDRFLAQGERLRLNSIDGHSESIESRRDNEIEELAALLASESENNCRVNLESIATAHGITFSYGHYRDCFDGLLECLRGKFHIYINLHTNRGADSPRARFSFAHELGHYFLDWHRAALDRGVPSHGSIADFESGNLAEREADMFAANLLLPTYQVKAAANSCIDAAEIVRLSQHFGTSLSATAIRCARLNLAPLIVMRWTTTQRAWCWSSSDFTQRTGNKAFRLLERIPEDSVTRRLLAHAIGETEHVSKRGTTLSVWFPAIRMGSSSDDILFEECISLGAHGALTILSPP